MRKQNYRFRSEDIERVRQWLLRNGIFPPDAQVGVEKLQTWCESHLNADQWRRLQHALRSRRKDLSGHRTVQITAAAHQILMELANREQITISEVIERYYGRCLDVSIPEPKKSSQAK